MIDIKEYVENVLLTAVQAVFPSVDKLIYRRYDRPTFRRWDAVYIELTDDNPTSCGKLITLDVTGMDIEGIKRTVTEKLNCSIPKHPIAATEYGHGVCPRCKTLITEKYASHCSWCSQAIDWRK